MEIKLKWDGDRSDLEDDQDMSLVDDIMWLLDYGDKGATIRHNNIEITAKGFDNGKEID